MWVSGLSTAEGTNSLDSTPGHDRCTDTRLRALNVIKINRPRRCNVK